MKSYGVTKVLLVAVVLCTCCFLKTISVFAQPPKSNFWKAKGGIQQQEPEEKTETEAEPVSETKKAEETIIKAPPAKEIPKSVDKLALTQQQDEFAQSLAHFAVGYLFESLSDNESAFNEYLKVLELDPSREDVALKVCSELLRRHDYKRAVQVLEEVRKHNPKDYAILIMLSLAYRSDQRNEDALRAAREAQKLDSSKITAYQIIMEVALDKGEAKESLKALESAARQKVDNYRYWLQLGELFAILREREPDLKIKPETVAAQFEKALAMKPEDLDVLVRLADFHLYTKNLKKAIPLYLRILEQQPDAVNIYQKLALSYVQEGDKKQAVSTLEELVKKEPLKFQIYNLIAELNESLKDWQAAKTAYQSSLIVNPDQLEDYLKLCLLELRLQNYNGAFEILGRAKDKFSQMPQVSYFYGITFSEMKDYKKSVASFEEAYLLSQSNSNIHLEPDFYFYYGAACERNGEFDRAVDLFKKAIGMNPDYADAYNYLGYMYADKGINLEESLKLIEKAVSYDPNNGAFIDSLGWIYYKLEQYDKALVELQKAVELIKDDTVVFEHLGDVYQKLGKPDQAAIVYKKAYQRDPKNEALLKKLREVGVDPTLIPPLERQNTKSFTAPKGVK